MTTDYATDIECLRRALWGNPGNREARLALSDALEEAGEIEEAIKHRCTAAGMAVDTAGELERYADTDRLSPDRAAALAVVREWGAVAFVEIPTEKARRQKWGIEFYDIEPGESVQIVGQFRASNVTARREEVVYGVRFNFYA